MKHLMDQGHRTFLKVTFKLVVTSFFMKDKGVDYLPFLKLDQMQRIPLKQDSSSPAITVPTGLPFDNSVQTQAFVSHSSFD